MEQDNQSNIIWLDANVNNNENQNYLKNNKDKLEEFKIFTYLETENAIKKLKEIKFTNTYVIVSGRLYDKFIQEYMNNLNKFNVVAKIIIFTGSVEGFKKWNEHIKNIYEDKFYNAGGIQITFFQVLNFIISDNNKGKIELFKNKKGKFKFEKIDSYEKLILPMYYTTLITNITNEKNMQKFNQFLSEKSQNNKVIFNLFNQISLINDIPSEILCKYYIKAYTVDKDFCYEMNKELFDGNIDNFLSFINVLFEGIKLDILPKTINDNLYHSTKLSLDKLNELKNYLNEKNNDFPNVLIFSKTFISFTKDLIIAQKNITNQINDEIPVIFVIEKNENINYDFSSHCDIENFSYYPNEREVLFLPFSGFEILKINESEGINYIYLNLITESINKISNKINTINPNDLICSSLFKEEFNLISKDLINSMTYKQLFDNVKKCRSEIICKFDIPEEKVGKKVQILNCYEEVKKRFSNINGKNNQNELNKSCEIFINNEPIGMTFEYTFNNKGIYEIRYLFKKPLTNANYLFYECSNMISISFSNFYSNKLTNMYKMFFKCFSLESIDF